MTSSPPTTVKFNFLKKSIISLEIKLIGDKVPFAKEVESIDKSANGLCASTLNSSSIF